jgi:uncharacterized membrane protein (UPF0182 family)
MRDTLDQSLEVIFGAASASPPSPAPEGTAVAPPDTITNLVQAALQAYQDGQQALQQGDWQRYGAAQQQLEGVLQELNRQNP